MCTELLRSDGVRGLLIYLAIYMFMNLGTFACILLMRKDGRMVEQIDELSGLSKTNPAMAMVLAIFMFSMAGIPPLAGFFGKLYVFLAAIQADMQLSASLQAELARDLQGLRGLSHAPRGGLRRRRGEDPRP